MAITFELESRLADSSLVYEDGKIRVADAIQSAGLARPKMDVRDFVTGALNDDNIDDAIEAAKAQAHVELGASVAVNALPWAYDVFVPAGRYVLSARHDFPGTGVGKPTPGLVCEGSNKTIFVTNSDAGEWCFTFGDSTYSLTSSAYQLNVGGFTLMGNGASAARSGLQFFATYRALVQDVTVFGFDSTQTFDKGWGFHFAENGSENHQHLILRRCRAQETMVGFYMQSCWGGAAEHCYSHGNAFFNVVFDNSNNGFVWHGGEGQRSGIPSSAVWHSGRVDSNVVTGWSRTSGLGSGSGATCGAASAGLCTVTGLSGLNLALDRGRWLELIPTGATDANKTTVKGLYKIERVLSATSCIVRKGSNHTSQGSCDWQIRGNAGGNNVTFQGGFYDEGSNKKSTFGFYRDEVGSSRYAVRDCESNNTTYAIETDGVGSLVVENLATNSPISLRKTGSAKIDMPFSAIHFDDYSYPGLVCRHNTQQNSLGGALRDSGGGRARGMRSLVKELGAAEGWDAELDASFTLATLNVNAWAGFINNRSMTFVNAAAKPQYVAADGQLGKCVQITGGTGDRGMTATLLAASLPTFRYTGSLFAVLRLGSAADHTAGGIRRIDALDGSFQVFLGLNDDGLNLDPWYGGVYTGTIAQADLGATAADTNAHAMCVSLSGDADNVGVRLSMDFQGSEWTGGQSPINTDPSYVVGGDITVNIAPQYGTNTDEFFIAFLAYFPRALTEAEHRQLIDTARLRWPNLSQ